MKPSFVTGNPLRPLLLASTQAKNSRSCMAMHQKSIWIVGSCGKNDKQPDFTNFYAGCSPGAMEEKVIWKGSGPICTLWKEKMVQ